VPNWEEFVRSRLSLPDLTPEREARIVRELAAQLEDFYREALARGASESDAETYARAQVRDWDRFAQDVWLADRVSAPPRAQRWSQHLEESAYRKGRRWSVVADLLQDLRYAVRQLLKSPGFTAVAVLTLALGIGANTAIFSVVNGVLLRPLPYPDADSLVRVHEIVPQYGRFAVAPPNFYDWREQNTVFERMAMVQTGSVTLAQGELPERLPWAGVSWDLFELLRVQPIMGRSFAPEEDVPGKANVVVLSHGAWQRRFGGDPGVVGRPMNLDGASYTIIGVMPAGFYFPSRETEIWTPVAIANNPQSRGAHFVIAFARMKPGVTVEQADAEMKTIAARLAEQYPDKNAGETAEVVVLHEQMVGRIRPALLTLLAAVGLVVLIACGNVANLLLVRASVRAKELAIRTALGAGCRRLVLQMLAESAVLALAGGAVGLWLAYAALAPIRTLSAGSIPRVDDIALDGNVLAFTLGLSLLTGVIFGLAPAWQAQRANLNEVLKEGGRTAAASGGRWLRNGLVIAEVALSLVLLVGASLLLRSFSKLNSVDPGFRPENVLSFRVALPRAAYSDATRQTAFYESLVERLEAMPQVTSAAAVQTLPMRGTYVLSTGIVGRPPLPPSQQPSITYRVVAGRYFETLGIPLLRGRAFTARDTASSPGVVIVDQAFVNEHFRGEDPLGRQLTIGNGTNRPYEIVGVVGDVRTDGLEALPAPTMYVPLSQDPFSSLWFLIRTSGDPAPLATAARQALLELDRTLPAFSISPLADVVSETTTQRRFSMLLLALFAFVALFLAAVGLFGVLSYTVSQRTQEMGLRLALGARRGHLLRLVVGQGMRLAVVGVLLGLAGALALARTISAMLFEVTPFDPVSYGITAACLLATAALACYVPARRATRVDPIIALRYE
jgi:putative ABC transport system permease protein